MPYQEKEIAKALGASWDARRNVWYVIDLDDLTSFAKWLPQPSRISHRSSSYVLLESWRDCWKCQRQTGVFGFAMPRGHDQLWLPDVTDRLRSRRLAVSCRTGSC